VQGTPRAGALVFLVIALSWVLSSCGAPAPGPPAPTGTPPPGAAPRLPAGTTLHTLTVDGLPRQYLVHQPADLPPGRPVPLVVMIHGGGGTARGAEARYGWDPLADRTGFVVAYPQGAGRSWSDGAGCCGRAGRRNLDDVTFLTSMVTAIRAQLPVDPARIYATGISEGGIMSDQLACGTDLFAAIGPDSATRLGPCPAPKPISLIHIHGAADQRIPLDGHPGAGVNHITGPSSVPDLVAAWRAVDGCPPPTVTTAGPVHTTSAGCPDGRAVTLIVVDGAGHQWPGSRPAHPVRPRAIAPDPPSTALDATATIWDFFAAHPR
jgi:polyhydroxybutyrate depolymerase